MNTEQFTLSSVDYANLYQMFTSWVEEETQDSVSDILNYAKKKKFSYVLKILPQAGTFSLFLSSFTIFTPDHYKV